MHHLSLTKCIEKNFDGNYARMLRAIVNKSWKQHPTKQQLYGHLPPISKTIQIRRRRRVGHYWRSKDVLISDVLLWAPSYGWWSVGRPARTYLQQLCMDTRCLHDLPEARWERVRETRASSMTWCWWYIVMDQYIDTRCIR